MSGNKPLKPLELSPLERLGRDFRASVIRAEAAGAKGNVGLAIKELGQAFRDQSAYMAIMLEQIQILTDGALAQVNSQAETHGMLLELQRQHQIHGPIKKDPEPWPELSDEMRERLNTSLKEVREGKGT